jgi:hypothetical protein
LGVERTQLPAPMGWSSFAMGLVPIDRHSAIDWPQEVRAREKATNNRKSIRNYSHKKQAHGNSIRN